MPPVTDLAAKFHDQLERQDMQALGRIVQGYRGIVSRLQGDIDALALEIAEMENPSQGAIEKLNRYKRLLRDAAAELNRYEQFMEVELSTIGRGMVERGLSESKQLVGAAVGNNKEVMALFRDLPPEAVERLLGFLDPEGPLYARLKMLAPTTVDKLAQYILNSVALGKNPRTWAREITRVFGVGLSDSLRMARTVQLYSYREATKANYIANKQIVRGWVWWAKLDSATCLSCMAQHGTEYPVEASLNDHHNGRCVQVPLTILDPKGYNPVGETGQDYFNGLSEAEQRARMGKGRHEAWKDGKFTFDRLTREHSDDVYGLMKSETPLKDLVND